MRCFTYNMSSFSTPACKVKLESRLNHLFLFSLLHEINEIEQHTHTQLPTYELECCSYKFATNVIKMSYIT